MGHFRMHTVLGGAFFRMPLRDRGQHSWTVSCAGDLTKGPAQPSMGRSIKGLNSKAIAKTRKKKGYSTMNDCSRTTSKKYLYEKKKKREKSRAATNRFCTPGVCHLFHQTTRNHAAPPPPTKAQASRHRHTRAEAMLCYRCRLHINILSAPRKSATFDMPRKKHSGETSTLHTAEGSCRAQTFRNPCKNMRKRPNPGNTSTC